MNDVMNKINQIKVGTKLLIDGYEGTVTKVCDWDPGLLEIRLNGGGICTGRSDFDGRYESCKIVEI